MLSDEEKEATEWLKRLVKINKRDNLDNTFAEILLNLIEKQSKEIEELKDMNERQQYRIKLVSEDEIEELKKKPIFLIKDIYSPKLKEISLQDVEGLLKQGREEIKDKIKAKIEEINKEMLNEENSLELFYRKKYCKEVLQSLLEKE